ncbi:hypothetical protein RB597_007766 [Gaeumannomyces tritici]
MTTLKNRMIALGFNTSPMIISYVAGPVIAERCIGESSFRWALASSSLASPSPFALVLVVNERKSRAAGILTAEPPGRSWVDAYRPTGCSVYLRDRTVLGGCMAYGSMFVSIFYWDTYYFPYLQVAHSQDMAGAGNILNAFSLTSAALGVLVGVAIRWASNVKWAAAAGVACCTALFGGIAGGLWNKVLPAKLAELLSDEAKPDAAEIFGDMVSQMAQGGAIRDAIITTYGQAQHLMVIAGRGFVASSLLLWRNINVKPVRLAETQTTRLGRRPIWVMGPKSG